MAVGAPLALGQRCELLSTGTGLRASLRRFGDVMYIGEVRGLPAGEWIGVRLDKPLGKNDGAYEGTRYFECEPLHGAFVRREKLTTQGDIPLAETQSESILRATEARRKQLDEKRKQDRAHRADYLEQSSDELVQAFWKRFLEKEERIRRHVGVFVDQKKQPTPVEPAQAVKLDDQVLQINELREEAASAASLYLSPYDIRQTQLIVAKLLDLIETTRTAFAPRKKFTFKARAAKKRTESSSPSADHRQQPQPQDSDTNQREIEKKVYAENEDELVFADRSNEVIIIDESTFAEDDKATSPSGGRRRDLSFLRLTNCTVFVSVETSAIRGNALTNCVVYAGPIYGSLWLEHCRGSDFFVACRQLRVHLSSSTNFHLRIASHPIIEDCHQLRFGAYKLRYTGLEELLVRSGLQRDNGLWAKVNDFKWHKTQQSPNWSLWDPKQTPRAIPDALQQRLRYE